MITNGKYRARANGEVVLGTSANKGTPYIELYFVISEGENKGGAVRWTSYFAEKTSERTIEALQHCGWLGDDLKEFSDRGLHGLDKNEVEIVVELEDYEKDGETRTSPRVQWVNRAGGGRYLNNEGAMSPEAAQSFGERMRGLVLAVKEKQSKGTDFSHGANVQQPPANGNATPANPAGRKSF